MRPTEPRTAPISHGDPQHGGVGHPDPIILPVIRTLFTRRAARLDALAEGNPMAEWLRFLAHLVRAQADAATHATAAAISATEVERAVAAQMPPLAADSHRRDPVWLDSLSIILHALESTALPEAARAAIERLREQAAAGGGGELEQLADAYLGGGVPARQAAEAVYVAAALQVYFAQLAASLAPGALALLPQRGRCPVCGSAPVAGMITAAGKLPGLRYLHCGLCATAWNHVRAACVNCGESRSVALHEIEGGNGAVKAETCEACRGYAKMLYQAQDMQVEPMADDLASLGLDMLLADAGWSRHAPNPLILVG
jgi:FdhE protein